MKLLGALWPYMRPPEADEWTAKYIETVLRRWEEAQPGYLAPWEKADRPDSNWIFSIRQSNFRDDMIDLERRLSRTGAVYYKGLVWSAATVRQTIETESKRRRAANGEDR